MTSYSERGAWRLWNQQYTQLREGGSGRRVALHSSPDSVPRYARGGGRSCVLTVLRQTNGDRKCVKKTTPLAFSMPRWRR